MGNAMLLTQMSVSTSVSAGGTVPLGSAVHGYGHSIRLSNNAINLYDKGYYDVLAAVSGTITGTSAVTVNLLENGTVVNSTTITPAAAGDAAEFVIPWIFRKGCCCNASTLTITASGAMTVTGVTVKVEKV